MDDANSTRCRHCERQFRLQLGVGMLYWPLEEVIRYTRGNARRSLQDIVAHHQVSSAEYGHRLFACPGCDTLHERFYVRVDYDEGKLYQGKLYETTFRCGKCRTQLVEPTKPITEYRCSECGGYSLTPS